MTNLKDISKSKRSKPEAIYLMRNEDWLKGKRNALPYLVCVKLLGQFNVYEYGNIEMAIDGANVFSNAIHINVTVEKGLL